MTGPIPPPPAGDPVADAAQDWFLRIASGEVSAADWTAFRAWCAADPMHRAAYEEVRALWDDLGPLEPAFAPAESLAAAPPRPAARPARRPWPALAAGAAAAAAAGLVMVLLLAPALPSMATLTADHGTAVGVQRTVTLSDGSVAHLNTGTALDVDYSADRRLVRLLRGEAQFEVRPDAARPFTVEAQDGRTTAVGTVFAVREDGGGAVVTVSEGAVRVASAARTGVLVQAGQQVRYARGSAPGSVRALDAAAETAWRTGQIIIRGRPLADALAEVDRYRPGRIVLLTDGADSRRVSARVALDDLDGGIEAIAATHGLTPLHLTPYLVLLR